MYQTEAKGTIFLLITALIWGSAFVAQSMGMDYVGPFTFSAARDVVAIIVLIPVILLFAEKRDDGSYPPIWQQLKPDAITLIGGAWCGLTLGIADTLQQVGISMTTAGKAGFITASTSSWFPSWASSSAAAYGASSSSASPWLWSASISYASTAILKSPSATSSSSSVRSSLPCTSWSSIIFF